MLLRHHLGRHVAKTPRKSPLAMLLGFAPIIVFAVLANLSQDLALWAAFATAFAVGIRVFSMWDRPSFSARSRSMRDFSSRA
jgi:hypothetical protein